MSFIPYVGEGQMHSRDVLNEVRARIFLGKQALALGDVRLAGAHLAAARNAALEYIANMGHADINTAQRLAKLCGQPRLRAVEAIDPYRGMTAEPKRTLGTLEERVDE